MSKMIGAIEVLPSDEPFLLVLNSLVVSASSGTLHRRDERGVQLRWGQTHGPVMLVLDSLEISESGNQMRS